jgi:hypothetical protein
MRFRAVWALLGAVGPAARIAWGLVARLTIGLAVLGLLLPASARAQLSLYYLGEAQAGSNPFQPFVPSNRTDLYQHLDLAYAFPSVTLGARFETDHNSSESDAEPGYQGFSLRWVEWSDDHLRFRVGNFYTILGYGLIHRSFELPGVILDQQAFPSRYTPSRDVDGGLAEATVGPVNAILFSGQPNSGEFSLAVDETDTFKRYLGLLSAAQITTRLYRESKIGAAYERYSTSDQRQDEYATGFAEVDPLAITGIRAVRLPLTFEYARKSSTWSDWWTFSTGDRDTAALYASSNLLWGPIALSAEWKSYRDFRLGFNDPPSLVREHSFHLLNRNTHVLIADNERGYQIEGSYGLPQWGALTLNWSRSDGYNALPVRFEERYAELRVAPHAGDPWEATVFLERGKDTFAESSTGDRSVAGGVATVRLLAGYSITVDYETLIASRLRLLFVPASGGFIQVADAHYVDRYATLSVERAGWGSVSLVWERTNNPIEEDPDDFGGAVDPNTFYAAIVNARLGQHNEATLFVGKRRGGLACTAGTCYTVQPFEGAELRLTSRF